MKKQFLTVLAFLVGLGIPVLAKGPAKEIKLLQPEHSKGKIVLQAMKDRHSSREFADKQLDIQTLSELLWAAGGINREDGRRTFPTAMNAQEIDIYVFMKDGVYLYVPQENKLTLVLSGDKRAATGNQAFVADAAVNLVYVSDLAKIRGNDDNWKMLMTAVNIGHSSENVYLYCSSADLACVVRAFIDGPAVAKLLKLKDSQKIIIGLSVGYKK
ncbi:MAG: SagB/ThcOx family dehydrogenase [Endomicrobia bacterium]|nr:SagB/ThcOx family dehydrogenase [Bacillota bacterium]MCL1973098.1 SagB/ThcOx family dehydrogenase [Endomicrobiia bacterium]